MQVIIEEVVSELESAGIGSLSPRTMQAIVEAVLSAIDAREQRGTRIREELSLQNYQQRTPHGDH